MKLIIYLFPFFLLPIHSVEAEIHAEKKDKNLAYKIKSALIDQEVKKQKTDHKFKYMMSSSDGLLLGLRNQCYKCCVGEGPQDECLKDFKNWKRGKNCGCE